MKFEDFIKVIAMEGQPKTIEITLRGKIDDYNPSNVDWRLKEHSDAKEINVYLNCKGGDAWAANEIFNRLIEHPALVKTHNIGVAASAGSYVLMAADPGHIYMAENAITMIHLPYAKNLPKNSLPENIVELLENHKKNYVKAYMRHSTLTEKEIIEHMENEKYFSAEAALEAGLASVITHKSAPEVAAYAEEIISALKAQNNPKKETKMNEKLIKLLMGTGIAIEASAGSIDDSVVSALSEKLTAGSTAIAVLAQFKELLKTDDDSKLQGALQALIANAEVNKETSDKLAQVEAELSDMKREEVFQKGREAGKITKAMEDGWMKDADIATIEAYLETAPKVIDNSLIDKNNLSPVKGPLSEAQVRIAKLCGNNPEEIYKESE